MEENSGIYLIMNQINGKGYVGQAVNIEERWKQHKYRLNGQYHGNKHLQNAWNKYGKDNFVFIILEKCAKFGKKNTNQTGILNVSCRKDGCNLYRYYDDNGKRQCISSMDFNRLIKE